ncbi:MAG: hypothetical protein STSR0004_20790 [Peptococcaceae bacterium]
MILYAVSIYPPNDGVGQLDHHLLQLNRGARISDQKTILTEYENADCERNPGKERAYPLYMFPGVASSVVPCLPPAGWQLKAAAFRLNNLMLIVLKQR